ncbi:MAG: efflux RND transporter periplasmic adaptor subunit [Rikenellaceae bacterium]
MTKKSIIATSVVVALVGAGAAYLFIPKGEEAVSPKWMTTVITKQNIVQSVTATGTVEPVTTVDIGTQVSGILTTLYVDYNSVVKEGQVIAELDKSTLILERDSKRNSVNMAQSELKYQTANYKRVKALHDDGLIADSDYEVALYNFENATNNLEIAKNDLEKAETNLGYATIYSPIDGVVLSKSVEEGQTVASSFSTPTLFTVAADLKDMQIIADVDEADIGNVTEGQKATFSVDAFPLDTFEGVITQVRQEGIEESNVITYEVVISAANPDLKLKPGLTANIEIFTLNEQCDMTISSAALSFTPTLPEGVEKPQRPEMPEGVEPMQTIWIKKGDAMEPRRVKVGVTNGILTEISGQGISLQDSVITGMDSSASLMIRRPGGGGNSSPFAPQRPGGPRK